MGTATVKYQYGDYSGKIEVSDIDDNDDYDEVCEKAEKQLFANVPRPVGCYSKSFKIIDREYD